MDQYKTGKFIACLRRERGMTQEMLGMRLGVTGKTISRWETGVYMPDVEKLELLSRELTVSVDEIIAGERNSANDFLAYAEDRFERDDACKQAESSFSLGDRISYFKRKWFCDHTFELCLCVLITVAAATVCGLFIAPVMTMPGAFAAALVLYCIGRNDMMSYIERHVFSEEKHDRIG